MSCWRSSSKMFVGFAAEMKGSGREGRELQVGALDVAVEEHQRARD